MVNKIDTGPAFDTGITADFAENSRQTLNFRSPFTPFVLDSN